MTILSVDREMRLRGGWWLQLMSGGRSNVPAMPGSERIMNSKSTGKFEWKCVSGVLVLGIRLPRIHNPFGLLQRVFGFFCQAAPINCTMNI